MIHVTNCWLYIQYRNDVKSKVPVTLVLLLCPGTLLREGLEGETLGLPPHHYKDLIC